VTLLLLLKMKKRLSVEGRVLIDDGVNQFRNDMKGNQHRRALTSRSNPSKLH
jgi:hypothetical protein